MPPKKSKKVVKEELPAVPTKSFGTTWVCSFDIGKKNFAFCIEEFDKDSLAEIDRVKTTHNKDGTATDDMQAILSRVYASGKIVIHENLDLTMGIITVKGDKKLNPKVFYNMTDRLDSYKEYFDQVDYVIIEQQMAFGKAINNTAVKLGQHCFSYFSIRYPSLDITEFPAYHKTKVLGMEKPEKREKDAKKKTNRKEWAVVVAKEILELRDEMWILDKLKSVGKQDDLADTLLMVQAWKYLTFVA